MVIFVILQPLFFLRKTKMPLFFEGLPWIVYFEKSVRWRFFRVSNFELHMCESITILISLFRSKNVCSLADSFCVPVFVEVIVILLADFLLIGFISLV